MSDERAPAKGEPAPFTEAEVAALGRGTMPEERVARLLELHRPSEEADVEKSEKLRPVELDDQELTLAAHGYLEGDLEERFVAAGKQDRSRKRAVAKGSARPRLRPPSERRARKKKDAS